MVKDKAVITNLSNFHFRHVGGTGVTNISCDRVHLFVKAIIEHDDPDFFLSCKPLKGSPVGDMTYFSLHTTRTGCLSDFWRVFDRIKEEEGT